MSTSPSHQPSDSNPLDFRRMQIPRLPCGLPASLAQIFSTGLSSEPALEIFSPRSASDPEYQRLKELEQDAWRRPGITVSDAEVSLRVFGEPQQLRIPNPVIVLKNAGGIQGAIFTSICQTEGLSRIPKTYEDVSKSHTPLGDALFDYSVVANPNRTQTGGIRVFDPLVRSTAALARELGLKHLVAYSRGELFLGHIRFNPAFDRFDSGDSQADLDRIFSDIKSRYKNPTFFSLVREFAFAPSEQELKKAKELYPRWTMSKAKPTCEDLALYFSLDRWNPDKPGFSFKTEEEAFHDYAAFHFGRIGDRFQGPNHERLGARYIGSVFRSREDDLRSAFSNVLMLYEVPER